ncbi:MAG TPA: ATP-binding protein [Gemmatimonadaceae bacterium]
MTAAPDVAAMQLSDLRRTNAEWLRVALQRLRLRLQRHADDLRLGGEARRVDWLVAGGDIELTRSRPTDDEHSLARELEERERLARTSGAPPALCGIAELAGLTAFESDVLLLAAAPALDGAFARAFAELHDDPRRDHATLHLALSLYSDDVTDRLLDADCLMPSRRLRVLRLVDVVDDEREPLLTRRLSVDERVVDYLRGVNRLDARLAPFLIPVCESLPSEGAARAGAEASSYIEGAGERWCTVNVLGAADGGAREAARTACTALGLRPQLLDLPRFASCAPEQRTTLAALLGREARLAGLALVVDASGAERGSAMALAVDELIATLAATLVVITAERWPTSEEVAVVRVARPTRHEQRTLWRIALAPYTNSVNGEIDAIAQQFDFGTDAIADVVSRAAQRGEAITGHALWATCREQTGSTLDDLARRIVPSYAWDDIVVSDDVRAQLRELAAQVRQRSRVYESWGFGAQLGRGRGITALFAGPSGTGKTMAAEILAGALELDLYRIDLAGVVSKYIGETEKNLRRVFDTAEQSGAILFFDEADALFGTRTEVRDSHDRYANLEINYLLQRMEDYSGLAILATNRRSALDAAFLRRLRFVIDFPFPAPDDRRRIWERVFPAQADVAGLELALLSNLDLSGGNIRSIAVNAAFLAASEDMPIGMPHVMRAAAREYVKLSKPIGAADFGAYYAMARR